MPPAMDTHIESAHWATQKEPGNIPQECSRGIFPRNITGEFPLGFSRGIFPGEYALGNSPPGNFPRNTHWGICPGEYSPGIFLGNISGGCSRAIFEPVRQPPMGTQAPPLVCCNPPWIPTAEVSRGRSSQFSKGEKMLGKKLESFFLIVRKYRGHQGKIFGKCLEMSGKHPGKCQEKVGKCRETGLRIRRQPV